MDKTYQWAFISDLDRTLIHSRYPNERVVELYTTTQVRMRDDLSASAWEEVVEIKPLTYMTEKAYQQLKELLNQPEGLLIPCTMRNLQQVKRIEFFKEKLPPIVICTNGAQIYREGKLDLTWERQMRALITRETLVEEKRQIEALNLPNVEIRITEDFYLTLKFEQEESASQSISRLKELFPPRHRQVIQVGRKVFIIHPSIDKVHAVDYVTQGQPWEDRVFTSGDSIVDQRFTRRGQAILPAHASFQGQPTDIRTQKSGIEATEEILSHLKQQITHKI